MGGGVGAGGMAFAAQQMRRAQNELNAHMHRSAAARAARRHAFRRMGETDFEPPEARVDFPCFHLCQDCGYFTEPLDGNICPACGRGSVVDLTDEVSAQRVRTVEEGRRHGSPKWVKAVLAATIAGLALGIVAAFGWSLWAAIATGALSIPVFAVLLRPVAVLLIRFAPSRPARWHLPLSQREPTATLVSASGTVQPLGDPLTSPFSGKECVAYQLAVLFDVAGDARPPVWVLEEIEGTDFEVGGVKVAGDRALIKSPLEPVSSEIIEEQNLDLSRFLRERGLFDYEGEFELFESSIAAGDEVMLEIDEQSGIVTASPAS